MQLKPNRMVLMGVLALLLLSAFGRAAEEVPPSEYQVEAAFLFHFAQFVLWPPQAFASTNAPLKVGFLGDDPICSAFQAAAGDKTVNGRAFQILKLDVRSPGEGRHCHMVFISPSEKKRVGEILPALQGENALTVSRIEHFTDAGGMVNFVIEQKKVRFEINDAAARLAGLKISAKLLNLAKRKDS